MTNEQKKAAKEYKALLNVKLGFSEIYEAIVYADNLIRRRISIIEDLLGHTSNDHGDELREFTIFLHNAAWLQERLRMMQNLCHDDAGEFADDMDSSAYWIIGTNEGNNDE